MDELNRKPLPRHGYGGLAIMLIGEILMLAKIEPVYTWFTPIQWTGYILFVDALLTLRRGESFVFKSFFHYFYPDDLRHFVGILELLGQRQVGVHRSVSQSPENF